MSGQRIVVLGGGVGGIVVANRLRRLLDREHSVTVVDQEFLHMFAPSFTWVMTGQREGGQVCRDLRTLEKKGIRFIPSEIGKIDFERRKVQLEEQEIDYDYLIISLGVMYSSHEIPGLAKAWSFYHLEGAEGLRDALKEFRGGRVRIVVPRTPYKCPAAPFEGAFLLEQHFKWRKIEAEIKVITPEPQPLPVAGKEAGQKVVELLRSRRIGFEPGRKLQAADQAAKILRFDDGSEEPFDLLIATPLHHVPGILWYSGLAPEGGWVSVDRETLATQYENVYAIGDCTSIPLANGMHLPKAGVFAHGEAEVVARNIAAEISGGDPVWAFGGRGGCFLETGYGKAAYATGNFYAEPDPDVALRHPSFLWRWAKLGFERLWLWRWF